MSGFLARLFGPRVWCDACERPFRPELEDVPLPGGAAVRQMRCSRCGNTTRVAVISARGVELMREIQGLQLNAPGATETLHRLQDELKLEVHRP